MHYACQSLVQGGMFMYRYITIEREYASGGNEIGRRLAQELGYDFFDRNILTEAAKRLDIPAMYISKLEETKTDSFLFNLAQTALGGSGARDLPLAERLFQEEKAIIEEAAQKGSCVIVGRCAGEILKEYSSCLRVFICADYKKRIERAVKIENLTPGEAEETLKDFDRKRSSFYRAHSGLIWGSRENFDLILNSSRLGIDTCIQILRNL